MFITSDFEGGNVKVINIIDEKVELQVELRDTVEDWFFWCFKVCGAQGRTITFQFENDVRVGYFGAAVSYDLKEWKWQYNTPDYCGSSFTYTFSEKEDMVYFAHDMVYRPERFFEFAAKRNIPVKTLCKSEKGRDVPYIDIGKGKECILLAARHHACESTGSYVLEGALGEIIEKFSDSFRIICVPFVDYDGVVDGDQGKSRKGHDHNRDYNGKENPVYNSVGKIRELAENLNIRFAFDFHSPWHFQAENDTVFIPIKHDSMVENVQRFSEFFQNEVKGNALPYSKENNLMPGVKWNSPGSPCFSTYFINKGAELSFTLETAYFMANGVMFTSQRARESGKCFAKALTKYNKS